MSDITVYGAGYYRECCGPVDYHNRETFGSFFNKCAQHIAEELRPQTVLDVGCAFGYLVEALRDLGIEAWGTDISEYAISQAREDIKPFLRASSATDSLPNDLPAHYDLILNIEVLEHMCEEDALVAMKNICSLGDAVFFSSSAEDVTEPTHVNVQQPEYWADKFAQLGFYKNLQYKTGYVSKYSAVFEKTNKTVPQIVRDYEHFARLSRMKFERELVINKKLNSQIEAIREEKDILNKQLEMFKKTILDDLNKF